MKDSHHKLKKSLGVLAVFSMASGAMISSGLFVLPAVIYAKAGPAIIVGYIFASLLMIPAMFSKAELATAMPKSGGTYFFVHRSMGPLFGTFAGFASWFSLSLKSTFALMGIGIFLTPLLPDMGTDTVKIIAIAFTIFFTILNILSVKQSGKFQIILLFGLITIIVLYIVIGIFNIKNFDNYSPFIPAGLPSLITITGMIFVSYGGLTKIASVAEEIKNPNRTIPLGMFAAFFIVSIIYVLTVFVTVGLLSSEQFLSVPFIPLSKGAFQFSGKLGYILLALGGMLAFITTANAGLLSASRDPMAMAKDNLIPGFFARINLRLKTPLVSTLITSLFMILTIVFINLEELIKVASTMMLILFSFVNLSVILMRESKIISYKPAFKAPLYPYIQIFGIIIYITLIIEMGIIPLVLTAAFFIVSFLWYALYSHRRSNKDSALIRIVERVSAKKIRSATLNDELRDILIERDEIKEDRFDRIIKQATILDIDREIDVDELFHILADTFSKKFKVSAVSIYKLLQKREAESSTAIHPGLAIPHIIITGKGKFDIVLLRCKKGINYKQGIPLVNIVFAIIGTQDERNFHLKALMAIAQIVQNKDFAHKWMKIRSTEELRNLILITQRMRKGAV